MCTIYSLRRQPYSLLIVTTNHLCKNPLLLTRLCAYATLADSLYLQMYAQYCFPQVVSLLCESSAMLFDLISMYVCVCVCMVVCVCVRTRHCLLVTLHLQLACE